MYFYYVIPQYKNIQVHNNLIQSSISLYPSIKNYEWFITYQRDATRRETHVLVWTKFQSMKLSKE